MLRISISAALAFAQWMTTCLSPLRLVHQHQFLRGSHIFAFDDIATCGPGAPSRIQSEASRDLRAATAPRKNRRSDRSRSPDPLAPGLRAQKGHQHQRSRKVFDLHIVPPFIYRHSCQGRLRERLNQFGIVG